MNNDGPRVLRDERPERWPLSIAVFPQLLLAPLAGAQGGPFLSHNTTIFISSTVSQVQRPAGWKPV